MSEMHAPEFSRRVELSRLTGGMVFDISAGPAERAGLAQRFGFVSLDRLEAEIRLKRDASGLVRLTARLSADLVQSSVVSLEPVSATVTDEFTLVFRPGGSGPAVDLTIEDEIVEPLEGDTIDLGEAVAQQLAVAAEPYPRLPGEAMPPDV